jgi:hypothetical protein
MIISTASTLSSAIQPARSEVYWAFLVWLYAAPAAPDLRQAAVPAGIVP